MLSLLQSTISNVVPGPFSWLLTWPILLLRGILWGLGVAFRVFVYVFQWVVEHIYGAYTYLSSASCLKSNNKCAKGVSKVASKVYKVLDTQFKKFTSNRLVKAALSLVMLLLKQSVWLGMAAWYLLPYFLIWVILFLFWFVFGYWLVLFAANAQYASANIDVALEGVKSLFNIVVGLINTFSFLFNIVNPFLIQILSFLFKVFASSITSLDTAFQGGGARSLLQTQDTSPNDFFTPRRDLVENELFTLDPGWQISTDIALLAEIGALSVLRGVLDFSFIFVEIVNIFIEVFGSIIGSIVDMARGAACCSYNFNAIGCCVLDVLVQLIVAVYTALGLQLIPGFPTSQELRVLMTCKQKDLAGVTCKCSTRFPNIAPCPPNTYECVAQNDGQKTLFTEREIDSEGVSRITGVGTSMERVCKRYLKSGATKKRGLLGAELGCHDYCLKAEDGNEWLFEQCGEAKVYKGHCTQKNLSMVQKHKHIQKFFQFDKTPPDEQRRMLRSIRSAATSPTPPPLEKNMNKETIRLIIKRIETSSVDGIEGCPTEDATPDDFYELSYRLVCIAMKVMKVHKLENNLPEDPPKMGFLRRHLNNIIDQPQNATVAQIKDSVLKLHIDQYKNYHDGEESILKHSTEFFEHIEKNLTMDRDYLKKGKQNFQSRGRKLDEGVFSSARDGPCEYLCPDGDTCVASVAKVTCKMPTKWTPATVVRYAFHTLIVTFEEFDIRSLVLDSISCWEEVRLNPAIDPASIPNVIAWLSGADTSNVLYCGPLIKQIPYLPFFTWNWKTFVTTNCETTFNLNTGKQLKSCTCPQYNTEESLDYSNLWIVGTKRFVIARITIFIRAFLFLFTRVPYLSNFFDAIWYPVTSFFTNDPQVLNAFNTYYQEYGLSLNQNIFCVIINMGSVSWVLLMAYAFYALVAVFMKLKKLKEALNKGEANERDYKRRLEEVERQSAAKKLGYTPPEEDYQTFWHHVANR